MMSRPSQPLRRQRARLAHRPGLVALAAALLLAATPRLTQAQQYSLRRAASDSPDAARTLAKQILSMSMHLEEDLDIDRRLYQNRDTMARTFAALPKNKYGRLGPLSVRYMIQRFFAGTRGWVLSGQEVHFKQPAPASNSSKAAIYNIFVDQLGADFESQQHGRGLSGFDVASIAFVLEQLYASESHKYLHAAYALASDMKEFDTSATSGQSDMHAILTYYLIVTSHGRAAGGQRTEEELNRQHDQVNREIAFAEVLALEFLRAFAFRKRHVTNPFVEPKYTYTDAVQMATALAIDSGTRLKDQCQEMKQELIRLDPQHTGSVALSGFYMQSSGRRFVESAEYLRLTGGLEEHFDRGPRVRVANYLLSPGLCAASLPWASFCCVNECDALMAELEDFVRAPSAKPELLLAFVGANLSSSTVAAPRPLPEHLVLELQAIAVRHGGEVPLYGRLFAQWLHVAFPYECPFPHMPKNEADARVNRWASVDHSAPPEERARLAEAWSHAAEARAVRHVSVFDDWEQLPLAEPEDHRPAKALWDLARGVALFVIVVAVKRTIGRVGRAGAVILGFRPQKEPLPFILSPF